MDCPIEGDILLVGEGDFSFTKALLKYCPGDKVTSTSLETEQTIQKHQHALHNVEYLRKCGVRIIFGVDACNLQNNPPFNRCSFRRIIFNFPHVGGKSNHKKNRKLLNDFFCSAMTVLELKGEIVVTLCRGQGGTPADKPQRKWPDSWQVVSMAANAGLILSAVRPFHPETFAEYSCTGFRSQDKWFHTEGAITHIFTSATPVNIPELLPQSGICNLRQNYITQKLKRPLLDVPGHPVHTLRRQLENVFQSAFPSRVISLESIPYRSNESLLGCLPQLKGDKSNASVDFRILSGLVYRNCDIQLGNMPVQHGMIGVYCTKMRDKPEHDFLAELKTALNEEFRTGENNVKILIDNNLEALGDDPSCMHPAFSEISKVFLSQDGSYEEIGQIYEKNTKQEHCDLPLVQAEIIFAFSLDKLLCQLAGISDPRLIWSEDVRFLNQFSGRSAVQQIQYEAFSQYPMTFIHDISFWENPDSQFSDNEFWEIIRDVAGDCVREVELQDVYTDPVTGKVSRCYRLTFQSCDQALSYDISWKLQSIIRIQVANIMGIQLR